MVYRVNISVVVDITETEMLTATPLAICVLFLFHQHYRQNL